MKKIRNVEFINFDEFYSKSLTDEESFIEYVKLKLDDISCNRIRVILIDDRRKLLFEEWWCYYIEEMNILLN